MKKLLTITLALVLTLVAATGCSKKEDPVSSNLQPIPSEEEKVISLEEAVKLFKQDPYTTVEGYELEDNGWLSKKGEGSIGNIHTLGLSIPLLKTYRSEAYALINGNLYKYSFGELVATKDVGDAIYCGLSEGNGFIFKDGDTVFAVSLDLRERCEIATGVKLVVDCDYAYNSDAWSQPLLLMKDNTLKVFVQWEDELLDPIYEGGYGGTLIEK